VHVDGYDIEVLSAIVNINYLFNFYLITIAPPKTGEITCHHRTFVRETTTASIAKPTIFVKRF